MNKAKLKGKMVEKSVTVTKLAELLEMHRSSVYRRLTEETFTIEEAKKIKTALDLTNEEANAIFFA